ncbi:Rho guanine nucleotide exchange factor [Marasmius crinis-equi]|uniref:Rho guanine nucleotide exchange factor n=1 Tax=Marasmius crinis-equi TaxID=585013 RepID=A0ABR3EXF7_9AGAR
MPVAATRLTGQSPQPQPPTAHLTIALTVSGSDRDVRWQDNLKPTNHRGQRDAEYTLYLHVVSAPPLTAPCSFLALLPQPKPLLFVKPAVLSSGMQRNDYNSTMIQNSSHGRDQNINNGPGDLVVINAGNGSSRRVRTLSDAVAGVGASHDAEQQYDRGDCLPGTREQALATIHKWRTSTPQAALISARCRPLHLHHKRLVEKFHQIQQQQHPQIRSVTAAMFDAALNFREAYMEYIPNYPIAAYRIDDELASNPGFKQFMENSAKNPDAHRLDMKNMINRPIPRLLRYQLLLKAIMEETPSGHEDRREIPQVLELTKSLGKDTEPGIASAKQKVELWRYNSNLVFKQGEWIDMDLLDENRSLVHSGKLLRQPDSGMEWSGWKELYALLFDNYLVLTEPKEREGITKYYVKRRPIPLDLLTLGNFPDATVQLWTGLMSGLRGSERHADSPGAAPANYPNSAGDSRPVYPLTLHHAGRMDGPYVLYTESAQARTEWKAKLEEALGLRQVVQEVNKVFDMEILSADTFSAPSGQNAMPAWNQENLFTGKVTCSVPFNTADGRSLVAIGCAVGVWIGFRYDSKSMRRVLHLRMVTQCAMLEEFGIFMVLADKTLFAYHIEALVPTSPQAAQASQIPQRLSGNDVHLFNVGQLRGRTLVIYMKKKGLDSIFRALEPVGDKINERARQPTGLGSRIFRQNKSEWFRIYRDFFLPSESFDLIFLKAKIVILCSKGFEVMDLNEFKSVTIPQRDDPRLAQLTKRCDSCRPMGMFRSADDEFLLCYDEFGLFVNKHGDPSRAAGTIEWEGTAERVALHSPYILLFDSRFIEVRHLETGRLVQIIPGTDIRCIWDGRGAGPTNQVISTPNSNRQIEVHVAMNSVGDDLHPRVIVQKIFQLVSTVPLYLHESASSDADFLPPALEEC